MADRGDRIRVHIDGKAFNLVGGSFHDMLAALKQIVGRRFISELKVWQLPGTFDEVQHQLDISGYRLEGGQPVAVAPAAAAGPGPTSTGDRIKLVVENQPRAVVGGSFHEMLAAVKQLPGRRFNPQSKSWEIPGQVAMVTQMIEAAGFQLEGHESSPVTGTPPQPEINSNNGKFNSAPAPFIPAELAEDDVSLPYEPPDWWDDENAPLPWSAEDGTVPALDEIPEIEIIPPVLFDEVPEPARSSVSTDSRRRNARIRVRVGGIPMVVTGGSFEEMLSIVKNFPGRRFDGRDKVWDIPAEVTLDSMQHVLEAAGFMLERDTS